MTRKRGPTRARLHCLRTPARQPPSLGTCLQSSSDGLTGVAINSSNGPSRRHQGARHHCVTTAGLSRTHFQRGTVLCVRQTLRQQRFHGCLFRHNRHFHATQPLVAFLLLSRPIKRLVISGSWLYWLNISIRYNFLEISAILGVIKCA
jgi:hypothetical protein